MISRILTRLLSNVESPVINWTNSNLATKSVRKQEHPYHLVDASPLPFLVSMALGAALCMTAFFFHD